VRSIAIALLAVISAASPQGRTFAEQTAVLAGGCFWGVELVFEHVRGVRSVTSGFARHVMTPSERATAVEAVRIVYDPAVITHRQLLEVLFTVAHDPTSRDRQGPDVGPEYRAIVFHQTAEEREAAKAYIAELTRSGRFAKPIVTEVQALAGFTVAGAEHQNYAARHPSDPYIVQNDAPKLAHLQRSFPTLYQQRRVQ
jgi:peptide-methionine (S)-S-oxide reductase